LRSSPNEKNKLPEYLELLRNRYPDYEADAIVLANLGMKINEYVAIEKHPFAVIRMNQVAWEVLNSIHCLIAYNYGLGAFSLSRNLFEVICGTIFLIQHPEKTQDFIDYGKKIGFELAQAMGANQPYLAAFSKHADYPSLIGRFGRKSWHGKDVRSIVEEADMVRLYSSFYKEASSVAHGDSFPLLGFKNGKWHLNKDVRNWSTYCEASLTFTYVQMAILYQFTVTWLKLPFDRDLDALKGRLIQKGLLYETLPSAP
jgi:hypothetical protein